MYVHTYARTQVQLSYLGALVMNHHQVVDDVQSKLPRGVQLQDVALLTGSLPKQTWQRVSHTHTHTCTWSKYVTFAAQTVRKKIILITELKVWRAWACARVCVCTWVGDTAPPQHRGCWLSSSGASGTWQRADRSWRTHRQVRQAGPGYLEVTAPLWGLTWLPWRCLSLTEWAWRVLEQQEAQSQTWTSWTWSHSGRGEHQDKWHDVSLSQERAEPSAHLKGERLQDVSLDGGGQQEDGRLWVVLVPVDVNALTLQQLQAALVCKHLNTPEKTLLNTRPMD